MGERLWVPQTRGEDAATPFVRPSPGDVIGHRLFNLVRAELVRDHSHFASISGSRQQDLGIVGQV